ncbi:MAG: hypothetical protein ACI4LA_10215 [Emergencia sp.]
MKNFIITAGAVLLMLNIMSWQFQINSLLREKAELKNAADEAAATAGICFDESLYGDGLLRFDRERAREKSEEILRLNLPEKGNAEETRMEITFEGENEGRPAVTVTLQRGKLKVLSRYEHVPY